MWELCKLVIKGKRSVIQGEDAGRRGGAQCRAPPGRGALVGQPGEEETTMDPEKRTLRRITLDDAVKADQIFTILMGEEVEPRKKWIEQNAKDVENLDI